MELKEHVKRGIVIPNVDYLNYTFDKFGKNSFFFLHDGNAYFTNRIECNRVEYLRPLFDVLLDNQINVRFINPCKKTLEHLEILRFRESYEHLPYSGRQVVWYRNYKCKFILEQQRNILDVLWDKSCEL